VRVSKITIKQNHSLGGFEHEHLTLEVELNEDDSVMEAIARARATLAVAFGNVPNEEEVAEAKRILAATNAATFS